MKHNIYATHNQYFNKFNPIKILPIYPQLRGYTGVTNKHKCASMKILTIVLFCTISFVACKSKTNIDFNVSFKPNSVYTINTKQKTKTEMVSQKNDKAVDQNGVENRSVIETMSKRSSSITTGSIKSDQSFSWKMTFDSITSTKAINSKNVNIQNPLKELVIEGTYDRKKKLHIDSLIYNTFDENVRVELKTSIEKIVEQFKFPSAQMSIGDEIIQDTPFEWTSGHSGTIKIHMSTKFRLKALKDDIAFFEISQNFDSINTKGNYIKGIGQGAGNCEYNFKKNYITKYQTSSNTNMTFKLFGQITKCKINSTYFQETLLRN